MRFPYKGAGIVLIYSDEVLIGKRTKRPFKNLYSIPGGGFEQTKDNTIFDCAIREFKEETSFDITSLNRNPLGKFVF